MAQNTIEIVIKAQDRASSTLGGLSRTLGSFRHGVVSALGDVARVASGMLAAQLFTNIAHGISSMATEALDAVASFERLTFSMQSLVAREIKSTQGVEDMAEALKLAGPRAEELIHWIEQLAIKSPFSQEGVAAAFRTAMAYGFTSEQAQRLTQATIDFSSATGASGESMDRIALALGQMAAKGRLMGQEVLQLTNAGVNVRSILEEMGYTIKDVSKGVVSADEFFEAFVQTMEEDFGGAAERQALIWSGLLNTLSDVKKIGLREFFGGIFAALRPLVAKFAEWLQGPGMEQLRAWGEELGRIAEKIVELGTVIATSGLTSGEAQQAMQSLFGPELTEKIMGVIDAVRSLWNIVQLLATGDFAGGIFGLQEDHPAIVALLTLRQTVIDLGDRIGEFVSEHAEELKGALAAIGAVLLAGAIVSTLVGIGAALASLVNPITLLMSAVGLLGAAWAGNWGGIREKAAAVIDLLAPKIEQFIGGIRSWWEENGPGILSAASQVWEGIQGAAGDAIATAGPAILDFVTNVAGWFRDNWPEIRATVSAVWAGISQAVQTVVNEVGPAVSDFITNVSNWFRENWPEIKTTVLEVWDGIRTVVGTAVSVIVDQAWPKLIEAFETVREVLANSGIDWETLKKFVLAVVGAIVAVVIGLVGVVVGVVTGVAGALKAMAGHFEALKAAGERIIGGLSDIISGFVDLVKGIIAGDWQQVWDSAKRIFEGAYNAIAGMVTGIYEVFVGNFEAIAAFVGGFVTGILDFFEGLARDLIGGSVIPDMIDDILTAFGDFVTDGLAKIEQLKDGLIAYIKDMAEKALEWVEGLKTDAAEKFEVLKRLIAAAAMAIVQQALAKFQELKDKAVERVDVLVRLATAAWEKFKSDLIQKAQEILQNLVAKWEEIKTEIMARVTGLVTDARTKIGEFVAIGGEIVSGLIAGLSDAWGAIKAKAEDLADSLPKWVRNALGIRSPSQVFWEIGQAIAEGLQQGIRDNYQGVVDEFEAKIEDLKAKIRQAGSDLKAKIREAAAKGNTEAIEGLRKGHREAVARLREQLAEVEEEYREFLEKMKSGLMEAGDLLSAAGALGNFGRNFASVFQSQVLDWFEKSMAGFEALIDKTKAKVRELIEAALVNPQHEVVSNLLDLAGGLAGVGGSFAGMFKEKTLKPLEDQLSTLQGAIEDKMKGVESFFSAAGVDIGGLNLTSERDLQLLQRLADSLSAQLGDPKIIGDVRLLVKLQTVLNEKTAEYARQQERLAEFQRQQQNFEFLQKQLDLLDLIRENGLNAGEILGGMTLGLEADVGGLMDAMTRAVEQLVDEANQSFGLDLIAGPRRAVEEFLRSANLDLTTDLEQVARIAQEMGDQELLRNVRQLMDYQTTLVAKQIEYNRQRERMIELERQQANIGFLQTQLDLLTLITEQGLDVGQILGGMKLGLDADAGGLLDAMTRAMQELVGRAEAALGIGSPSRVFAGIGRSLMSGLAEGVGDGLRLAVGAVGGAAAAVTTHVVNNMQLTVHTNSPERVVDDFLIRRAMAGA